MMTAEATNSFFQSKIAWFCETILKKTFEKLMFLQCKMFFLQQKTLSLLWDQWIGNTHTHTQSWGAVNNPNARVLKNLFLTLINKTFSAQIQLPNTPVGVWVYIDTSI
jgi:hypothetical protein